MSDALKILRGGTAIPAHPLALTEQRKLDERRQRALSRYYITAGVGGLAVGVHTTQFAIRDAKIRLFKPVLELAAEEMRRADAGRTSPLVRIAGVCGKTSQATNEAKIAIELGYHAVLLSLAAMKDSGEQPMLAHCRAVAEVIPIIGFYLQPAVGGRVLPYSFWRQFAEIPNVVAIKIAPFNRYQTLDVVRAVVESRRDDIAIYTGNDDNIVVDLLTAYRFGDREKRIVGGLLGHWSVWTKKSVEIFQQCRQISVNQQPVSQEMLRLNIQVTDANAAFFDAANNFAGCIAGLHEILRRQGLLDGIWCLNEHETLGSGQKDEIDRVCRAYPHLSDDSFIAEHRDGWLKD